MRCGAENGDSELRDVAETMLGTSLSESIVARWQNAAEGTKRITTARRQRNEQRAKALKRTPYPIVINRLRVLLDKIARGGGVQETSHRQLPTGFRLKLPTVAKEAPTETSPRSVHSASRVSPRSEPLSTARSLHEAHLDEASLLLAHVSGFLRELPASTRRELCCVVHIEETKREEVLFHIGDAPEKCYIILTGLVEVTEKLVTNDRREKFVIATLKKGHVFGEAAILNNKRRNATCVAVTHCTLLTVLKDDFLAVVGPYFFGQKRETVSFLRNQVSVFKNVQHDACLALLKFLMRVEYPTDREWALHREKHVYFIRRGTCALCIADASTKDRLADGHVSKTTEAVEDVYFVDGKPFGTLSKDGRKRNHPKRAQMRDEVANLAVGDYFGGGWHLLGDRPEAKSLRVIAMTPIEALVLPVDDLLTYADPEIIRVLREDAAFRFTYYFGRKGILDVQDVIGHPASAMLVTQSACFQGAIVTTGGKPNRKLERQLKQDNETERREFSNETEAILKHYREISESNTLDIAEARYDRGTPTERYWSDATLTRGSAHRQLDPLLKDIFPRGFDPLWEKRSTHDAESTMPERDVIAASVMWDRVSRPATPMRQCLTYAEIIRNKGETP